MVGLEDLNEAFQRDGFQKMIDRSKILDGGRDLREISADKIAMHLTGGGEVSERR